MLSRALPENQRHSHGLNMYTRDEAERLCAKILSYSTLPECEVELTATEEYYTRFANNGITTAGFAERRTAVIRSTRDGKTGKIQTGEMDDRALKASVKRTENLAAIAPADPEHQPPLGRQQYPEIHEFDERTANARAPEMIPQIGALVKIAGSKKLVAAGLFERSHTTTAVANKAGLFGYSRSADSHRGYQRRSAGQPSFGKMPALEKSEAARSRRLHGCAGAHGGGRHCAANRARPGCARHGRRPDIPEQERRRHAHGRKAISGVRDFAQRSVHVQPIRSAVDRRIASSALRKLGSKRSGEEHLLHALLGGKDREERDSVPRRAGSRWQRSFDRRLDSLSGSRPSGDAFLVHP